MNKANRVFGICFLLVTASIFLLPAITFAVSNNEDPGPEFNSGWIGALISLIVVVALAYWATRFIAGKFGISHAKHLKVAESLFLGPNRHLYLLLVNQKVLLIGSSEHGINLLQEINDPDFFMELQRTAENNTVLPVGKFSSLIDPILGRLHPRTVNEPVITDNKQRLLNGLEKIRSWKTRGRDQ